jgi:hypothetical protein
MPFSADKGVKFTNMNLLVVSIVANRDIRLNPGRVTMNEMTMIETTMIETDDA